MADQSTRPQVLNYGMPHSSFWNDAFQQEGKDVDWRQGLLSSYEASVDAPACLFVLELSAAFPDAKIVLMVRDPETWYDDATLGACGRHPHRVTLQEYFLVALSFF